MHYEPPSAEQIEALKKELGKDGNAMADLFGVANRRAFRRYTAKVEDRANRREIGLHMLFFAMARLELDDATFERIIERMRKVGAVIDLDSTGDSSQD